MYRYQDRFFVERAHRWGLAAAVAAALALVSVGCGDHDVAEDDGTTRTTTVVSNAEPAADTTVVTTTRTTDDGSKGVPATTESVNAGPGGATGVEAQTADEINTRIIRNPQMTGSRVNVVVDAAGVATLTGFTQNQQQKALAARAAENTPGVVSVENKLEIRPTGGTGKTPKPAPSVAAPSTTNVIVVPMPAERQSPAPAPSASPLSGWEPAPETIPAPEPSASPATLDEPMNSGS